MICNQTIGACSFKHNWQSINLHQEWLVFLDFFSEVGDSFNVSTMDYKVL